MNIHFSTSELEDLSFKLNELYRISGLVLNSYNTLEEIDTSLWESISLISSLSLALLANTSSCEGISLVTNIQKEDLLNKISIAYNFFKHYELENILS